MFRLRLFGLVSVGCVGWVQAVEEADCWGAFSKECHADTHCSQLVKCATDICAVPVNDTRPFKRLNMTCHLMCSCGLYDHMFVPQFVNYTSCLTRVHSDRDPVRVLFDDSPYPYTCPATRARDLVPVGLDAFEGTWYLTHGTSSIENLTCTQMIVTQLNDTHWLGSEYQEAQVGRLGTRWSQVAYLLTPQGPGLFDLRMMLPSVTNMSVCHAKTKIVGYSKDRWMLFQYCSVFYPTEIPEPSMGWWSFALYCRDAVAPVDAVDRLHEIMAAYTPMDARTNQTVAIPVKLTTHNQLCRYRHSAPADRSITTCSPVDITGGRRLLRGVFADAFRGYDDYTAPSPVV